MISPTLQSVEDAEHEYFAARPLLACGLINQSIFRAGFLAALQARDKEIEVLTNQNDRLASLLHEGPGAPPNSRDPDDVAAIAAHGRERAELRAQLSEREAEMGRLRENRDWWKQVAQDAALIASQRMSTALSDVMAERLRQINEEGWTPAHDDAHSNGELARAAACYATSAVPVYLANPPALWPWDASWWKPKDARRDLIRAGALIIAELDRLQRAALTAGSGKGEGT